MPTNCLQQPAGSEATLWTTTTFLDQEQEEAIRQFFQNFSIEQTHGAESQQFISLWDKLGDIYTGTTAAILQQLGTSPTKA